MAKSRRYELLEKRLTGRTDDQVRDVTRRMRPDLWPVDGPGGGRAAQEVPTWAVVNRILSVGSATAVGINAYVKAIAQLQFATPQHERVGSGSQVDLLLSKLAVKTPDPDDWRQAHGFIRGADATLHDVVTRMLDAICVEPEIADLAERLGMEVELLSGPPPFEMCGAIWLHENGVRYGWAYQSRERSVPFVINTTPIRVLIRSAKIPAVWFREYARLLGETPATSEQEAAA